MKGNHLATLHSVEDKLKTDIRTAYNHFHGEQGMTIVEVAKAWGIYESTLRHWLKIYSIPVNPHPHGCALRGADNKQSIDYRVRKRYGMTLIDWNREQWERGVIIVERAKKLGVNISSYTRALKKSGYQGLPKLRTSKSIAADKNNMQAGRDKTRAKRKLCGI